MLRMGTMPMPANGSVAMRSTSRMPARRRTRFSSAVGSSAPSTAGGGCGMPPIMPPAGGIMGIGTTVAMLTWRWQ